MWVRFDVLVILRQDRKEEFGFGMSDRFNDEPVVSRKVEKRP